MQKQSSMLNFFKKKPESLSSPTPLLMSYQSVPDSPILSSQPAASTPSHSAVSAPTQVAVSTPSKRKADQTASDYRRAQYNDYDKNRRVPKFLPHWKKGNPWLSYDKEQDIMWCSVCFEFKDKLLKEHSGDTMFMIDGTSQWGLQTVT